MTESSRPSSSILELSHPASGQVLRLAPAAGFCGISWLINGDEHLHLSQPLDQFLCEEHTGGLPLLYPWANRLRGDRWSFAGTEVNLAGCQGVHRDGHGRPMHGLLLRWSRWNTSDTDGGCMAVIDWANHEELMAAFPFEHHLQVQWNLDSEGLEVRTRVTAGTRRMPVSFGWHPYLVLPGVARNDIMLHLPDVTKISLDDEGLPILGEESTPGGGSCALREREWDDCYSGIRNGDQVVMSGLGKGLRMTFVEGWRFMQIYSPAGADFVCIEPMTALTAALSDGDPSMPLIDPGCTFVGTIRIQPIG
ncbi:MAG: aldose 1-epimerase [Planctomycetota bacterium]|nr:aldose 1-epimerase [Planctomycetota bacterium]